MLSGPGNPPFSKAYPEETKRLSAINSDEAALTAFAEGSISYIIAGIKEADSFNQKAAGLYSMNAINFDKVYAVYSDIFCISGKASEAETEAARMMLVYMLGEEQQKTMHITGGRSIPLSKKAYAEYTEISSAFKAVDSYLGKIEFVHIDEMR
ncbi:MAG: extracellular solute-binding protein, partial [Lachnospiraceae bacterium]|nr:extracellular solute-binding protein [Lachnospiraceae bacterium]